MRLMTKTLSILAVLMIMIMTLMTPALAATSKPVLVVAPTTVVAPSASAVTSAPLMPGDTGTAKVTIANTLKAATGTSTTVANTETYPSSTYEISNGQMVTTPAKQTTTTTQSSDAAAGCAIKSVALQEKGPVKVISEPYVNPGCIGGGDSITFAFTIKVDDNAADGTYYLPLTVRTDDDSVYLNQVVPVIVDSSGVRMFLNDAPSALSTVRSSIILDVVNYMQGGVNSVSVVPAGDEFNFKPKQEYVVGNIGPGEMYTVNFDVSSKNSSYTGNPSFVVKYKNGDNWHQSAAMTLPLTAKTSSASAATTDNSGLLYLVLGIVGLLVIVGGLFLFMRSQRAKK